MGTVLHLRRIHVRPPHIPEMIRAVVPRRFVLARGAFHENPCLNDYIPVPLSRGIHDAHGG